MYVYVCMYVLQYVCMDGWMYVYTRQFRGQNYGSVVVDFGEILVYVCMYMYGCMYVLQYVCTTVCMYG